jgi:hypothetical protein
LVPALSSDIRPDDTGAFAGVSDLRELGVPAPVIEYLAAQHYSRDWEQKRSERCGVYGLLALGVGFVALAGVFVLSNVLEGKRQQLVLFSSERHGWSAFLLFLGLVLMGIAMVAFGTGRDGPRIRAYSVTQTLLGEIHRWPVVRPRVRRLVERVGAKDPAAFVRAWFTTEARWGVWPCVALFALGVLAVCVDLGAYSVGTDAGVVRHSIFGDKSFAWSQLQRVEVGCYDYRRRSPLPSYDLVFEDGTSIDALAQPTPDTLRNVAALDAQIRARGVSVRRAELIAGSPLWSGDCTRRFAAEMGIEVAMLDKMLRPD